MSVATAIRLDRGALTRMVIAGSAWGMTLSGGFLAIALAQCGLPCPHDFVLTTATCVGTGILTIGPLAAFASPR